MSSTGEPAVSVDGLSKAYGDTVALRDIDLSVAEGEFLSVVGHSGCGKSTLLRVLAGLEADFDGGAAVDGVDVRGEHAGNVGMVFQEPRLLPWLSVRENIAVGLPDGTNPASEQAQARVDELVSRVGLDGFGDARPSELSGGMAQRVSLARGLAYDPTVMLLDEPFSALDALTKREQQEFLLDIWHDREITVVLVTHDIEEAVYLSDRVAVIGGQPGTVEEVVDVERERPRDRSAERLVDRRERIERALGL
ncbi:ABC transporter ATP-binding protein [Halolamina salifodinae]|uniref:ABC-type nitrate/sulfonate/bicarbonate transport system ATPase subunit n=1 Tax=Halolamina salifodinae TaxID=1202767 RepID=A0A8T4H0R6_9EURY|nr:ABC transporter ATP-binding protein [Halolamina salifodinae]MBP1986928.1 ABC-type nitrate/sulfonate/bicarbonate transport system ATPase subunit [Halolamina salifodinae]